MLYLLEGMQTKLDKLAEALGAIWQLCGHALDSLTWSGKAQPWRRFAVVAGSGDVSSSGPLRHQLEAESMTHGGCFPRLLASQPLQSWKEARG